VPKAKASMKFLENVRGGPGLKTGQTGAPWADKKRSVLWKGSHRNRRKGGVMILNSRRSVSGGWK